MLESPESPECGKRKWAILELWDPRQTGGGGNMDRGESWVPQNLEWGAGRGGSLTAQRGTEVSEV